MLYIILGIIIGYALRSIVQLFWNKRFTAQIDGILHILKQRKSQRE